MSTPSPTTPTSPWTRLTRLLGIGRTDDDDHLTDEPSPQADEGTPQVDELADPIPDIDGIGPDVVHVRYTPSVGLGVEFWDQNGRVSDADARTEHGHVLDLMTAPPTPAPNPGDGWNDHSWDDHSWDDTANSSSDWAQVPGNDVYDTPIPFDVPAWLQEARAVEYDDYDAAIPFHVVDDYTRHMSDDSTDTSDGDDL